MATIFPPAPTNGQAFTSNGITWKWDTYKWALFSDVAIVFSHQHSYDGDVSTAGGTSQITIDGGGA